MKSAEPPGHNASVEKAARLLFAFTDDCPELGVMELSRKVGLNKSTASRFIATLTRLGLLERTEQGNKFRLGTRLHELGMLSMRCRPLYLEAQSLIESLGRQTHDTVTLAVAVCSRLVFVSKYESGQATPMLIGRAYPLHASASGKILLSALEAAPLEQHLLRPLEKCTDRTIVLSRRLHDQIALARQVGYATDHEEFDVGLSSVAAPVYDRNAEVVAALALTVPAHRLSPGSLPVLARGVSETAASLSQRLGYRAAITLRFPNERRGNRGASASA